MHEHLTGYAALLAAATLFLHGVGTQAPAIGRALVSLIEAMQRALTSRADSRRLLAETRARVEQGREDTVRHLRAQVDERDGQIETLRDEIHTLRGQLDALRTELEDLRRSLTAGHARP